MALPSGFEKGGQRGSLSRKGSVLWIGLAGGHFAEPLSFQCHRVNFCFDGDALEVEGRLLATLYGAESG
ncbi:MAG: hypothetical protein U0350_42475 [Caldilineaceae bacterium]